MQFGGVDSLVGLLHAVGKDAKAVIDLRICSTNGLHGIDNAAARANQVFNYQRRLVRLDDAFDLVALAVPFGLGANVDHGFVERVGKPGRMRYARGGGASNDIKL